METFKRLNLQIRNLVYMTSKALTLLISALFSSSCMLAQNKLFLEGTETAPFVTYQVHQGESLSGISKKFGTSVGDIMRLNGMHADSKLILGAKIKVPVEFNEASKFLKGNTALVHKVQKGETLFRLAGKHQISVDQLKQWNKLAKDGISAGDEMIVGYVYASAAGSETESLSVWTPVVEKAAPPPGKKVASKNGDGEKIETAMKGPESRAAHIVIDPDVQTNQKHKAQPDLLDDTVMKTFSQSAPKETRVVAQERTAGTGKNAVKSPVFEDDTVDYSRIPEEGFFKNGFEIGAEGKTFQTKSGTAMSFKTASGWTDKKYYIMMNDAEPGAFVKISNGNGKFVYAKVLWNLGNIKENEGLDFRISNAAASVLGIADEKFSLQVTYPQ